MWKCIGFRTGSNERASLSTETFLSPGLMSSYKAVCGSQKLLLQLEFRIIKNNIMLFPRFFMLSTNDPNRYLLSTNTRFTICPYLTTKQAPNFSKTCLTKQARIIQKKILAFFSMLRLMSYYLSHLILDARPWPVHQSFPRKIEFTHSPILISFSVDSFPCNTSFNPHFSSYGRTVYFN